jgi:predicted GIY-YIG superfamily endonuclease
MSETNNRKSKWTLEICRKEALKYSYRTSFQKNSPAYKAAYKYGWLDDICNHMVKPKPTNHIWTLEACGKEAKKYNLKKDFQKKSNSAYQAAWKNKWLEQICGHMEENKKPHKYWTKEKCAEEALKFNHKIDFQKNSSAAYSKAHKSKWIDQICEHMTALGSEKFRYVYSFTFSDSSVYFGLTTNHIRRYNEHNQDPSSKVFQYKQLLNEEPIFKVLTPNLVATEIAQEMEKSLIKEYTEKGFNVLNADKGGGIGGSIVKWTFELCKKEALKYNTRGEFQKSLAYSSANKNGWLNEICCHMIGPKKPHNYWTKEKCKEKADRYQTKQEFRINASAAFNKAEKMKWLKEITLHMKEIKKPNGFWTLEKCIIESKKYKSYIEFQSNSSSAYGASLKNGWLKTIQSNFKNIKKPNGYWTFELCETEAKKYKNKRQFSIGASAAHDASYRNKWLDIFYPKNEKF